ncbi:MAG: TAXI family TRAP transporter solute-binding subunit, partial [Methanobacterium sp.]|nr:TAXI family TRAP transporter solute-binding subunit [Methanobacterium sp.]
MILAFVGCTGGSSASSDSVSTESGSVSETITIATGPTSGIYYPIGTAFGEALKGTGYETDILTTEGSAENIDLIGKGDADLAIAMQDSVMQAYEGSGAYKEKGANQDLRALMRLWPNYVQLITSESTGIQSVEDLKGKKVGVGAVNSGVELNARMIYEAYGMTYEDSQVDYLSYDEAIEKLKKGDCDAAFVTSGLPNEAVTKLSADFDMALVPIDGAGRDKLIEEYPYFRATTIPAGTYNNKEDVESVFVYNIMLVNKDLSEEMVYDMLSNIFANVDAIKSSHIAAEQNINLNSSGKDLEIPLHEGAAKFWEEKKETQAEQTDSPVKGKKTAYIVNMPTSDIFQDCADQCMETAEKLGMTCDVYFTDGDDEKFQEQVKECAASDYDGIFLSHGGEAYAYEFLKSIKEQYPTLKIVTFDTVFKDSTGAVQKIEGVT